MESLLIALWRASINVSDDVKHMGIYMLATASMHVLLAFICLLFVCTSSVCDLWNFHNMKMCMRLIPFSVMLRIVSIIWLATKWAVVEQFTASLETRTVYVAAIVTMVFNCTITVLSVCIICVTCEANRVESVGQCPESNERRLDSEC